MPGAILATYNVVMCRSVLFVRRRTWIRVCVCPVGTMRGATGCAPKQHYHGYLCGSDGVGHVSRLTKVVMCDLSCMEYDASA